MSRAAQEVARIVREMKHSPRASKRKREGKMNNGRDHEEVHDHDDASAAAPAEADEVPVVPAEAEPTETKATETSAEPQTDTQQPATDVQPDQQQEDSSMATAAATTSKRTRKTASKTDGKARRQRVPKADRPPTRASQARKARAISGEVPVRDPLAGLGKSPNKPLTLIKEITRQLVAKALSGMDVKKLSPEEQAEHTRISARLKARA